MTLDYWKNLILRPFAIFSFSFFLASCIAVSAGGANFLPLSAVFLVIAAVFGALCAALRRRRKAFAAVFAVFMLFSGVFLSLITSYFNYEKNIKPYIEFDGKEAVFTGPVVQVSYKTSYSAAYTVKTDSFMGETARTYVLLEGEPDFSVGDKLRVSAIITALTDGCGAPKEDSEYLFRRGVAVSAEAVSAKCTGKAGFSPVIAAQKLRTAVSNKFVSVLGVKEGGFCAALFLGDRSRLSDDVAGDFRALGISHILALSGMHLSVVCGLIYLVTKRKSAYLRRTLQFAVIIFYMLITGFSSTVVRAGLMLIAVLAAQSFGRNWDMITDIGMAALLICLWDPFAASDVGLQLSVAAVFAVALSIGAGKKKELSAETANQNRTAAHRIKAALKYLGKGVYVSLCVSVFILPLQWLYFTRISPVSPIVSVVISVFASLLLYLFPILLAFLYVPVICTVVAFPVKILCNAIFCITDFLSRIRGISVSVIYPGALLVCVLCLGAFVVFAVSRKRIKAVSGIVCLALFASLAAGGYIYPNVTRSVAYVDYENTGKNDAVSVCTDKIAAVIDVGGGGTGTLARCAERVYGRGFCEIEYLILTHTHNRHPSSVSFIFDKYTVRTLYVPSGEDDRSVCEQLRELCLEKHVAMREYTPGDVLKLSDKVSVSTRESYFLKRSNQPIISFDITAWGKTVSYLGASFSECGKTALKCDAAIFGAHGPVYKEKTDVDFEKGFSVIASDYADEFLPFARIKDSFVRFEGQKSDK